MALQTETKTAVFGVIYKATLLTALMLSMGVCSGFSLWSCAFTAIFASVVYVITPADSLLPAFLSWLITFSALKYTGTSGAIIAMMLAGLLAFISGRLPVIKEGIGSGAFRAALMLAAALSVTVLATTDYFGIGATGAGVVEMLKNYRSLGFHPNWRGILYGTIVMVIMITYPRKFKRASKVVSSMFAGILATYLLNFLLVPPGTVETFAMIKKPAFEMNSLRNPGDMSAVTAKSLPLILLFGVSLAIVLFMCEDGEDTDRRRALYQGTSVIIMPAFFGYTLPGRAAKLATDMLLGLAGGAIIAALLFPTGFFARLPVASCAVVLIVGAWQQVEWGLLKKAFSGVLPAVFFLGVIALSLLTNISAGIIAGAVAFGIYEKAKAVNAAKKADETNN